MGSSVPGLGVGTAFCFCSTPDSEAAGIIHDIRDEYVEIKREFVSACESQPGSPTLDKVKDVCIDLIEEGFRHIFQIASREYDIVNAITFTELARIICFRLSKWVNYEFFKRVIARFQPALKSVKERLMHYEDRLKPILLQKLKDIKVLQQR